MAPARHGDNTARWAFVGQPVPSRANIGPFGPLVSRPPGSRDTAPVSDVAPRLGPVPCIPCAEKAAGGAVQGLTAETLSLDAVPWHAPGLSYWRRGDQMVIEAAGGHARHELNGPAGSIWLNLDGAMSVGSLVEALHEQTGAPVDVLERDVRAAVVRMVGIGILVVPMEPQPAA